MSSQLRKPHLGMVFGERRVCEIIVSILMCSRDLFKFFDDNPGRVVSELNFD